MYTASVYKTREGLVIMGKICAGGLKAGSQRSRKCGVNGTMDEEWGGEGAANPFCEASKFPFES